MYASSGHVHSNYSQSQTKPSYPFLAQRVESSMSKENCENLTGQLTAGCCETIPLGGFTQSWAKGLELEATLLSCKVAMPPGSQWTHWISCSGFQLLIYGLRLKFADVEAVGGYGYSCGVGMDAR
jgi:hypothetical protein